jgi:hypothetical protein
VGTGRQSPPSSTPSSNELCRQPSDDAFVYRDAKWGVRASGQQDGDDEAAGAGGLSAALLPHAPLWLRGLSEELGVGLLAALAVGIVVACVATYAYSSSSLRSYYQEDGSIGS